MSLNKTHFLPTSLVNTQLHPNITEKLLTGMLNLSTNKQNQLDSSCELHEMGIYGYMQIDVDKIKIL